MATRKTLWHFSGRWLLSGILAIACALAYAFNTTPQTTGIPILSEAQASVEGINLYTMPAEKVCKVNPDGKVLGAVVAEGVHHVGKSQYVLCSTPGTIVEYVQYGVGGELLAEEIAEEYVSLDTAASNWRFSDTLHAACTGHGELVGVSDKNLAYTQGHYKGMKGTEYDPVFVTANQAWCKDSEGTVMMMTASGPSAAMLTWRAQRAWAQQRPGIYRPL